MPSLNDLRERINRELAAGWELYVAERNGRIVGMLAIKPLEAILDQIFVIPSDQSSGVGTCLLNFAKRAMPMGFTLRMALANRRAARFYEHSGLSVIREGAHPISGAPVQYLSWDGR
jgi:GNAT superfamily N-acetyltransferase